MSPGADVRGRLHAAAQAGGLTEADVIGDDADLLRPAGLGAAPTKGNVTQVETLKAYNGGSPTYVDDVSATYDATAASLESCDVRGNDDHDRLHPGDRRPGHRHRRRPTPWAG